MIVPEDTPPAKVTRLDDRRGPKVLGAVQLVRRYSKATGAARRVLTVLATYADADGTNARPSNTVLVRDTGSSLSTVQRGLRELRAAGEIELVRLGCGRTPSEYRIRLSPPGENPGETPTVLEREPCHYDTAGVSPRHGRGVTMTPNRPETDQRPGEGVEFPDHCPTHRTVEDPPPCRKCAQTREANAAARATASKLDADKRRRRRLADDRARVEAAKRAAAAADSPARQAYTAARQNTTRSGTLPTMTNRTPRDARP